MKMSCQIYKLVNVNYQYHHIKVDRSPTWISLICVWTKCCAFCRGMEHCSMQPCTLSMDELGSSQHLAAQRCISPCERRRRRSVSRSGGDPTLPRTTADRTRPRVQTARHEQWSHRAKWTAQHPVVVWWDDTGYNIVCPCVLTNGDEPGERRACIL